MGCSSDVLTREKIAKLENKPMPAFTPPVVNEKQLKNGATLFLLEDHELPIVNVYVLMRAGSIYEPSGKLGLASLTTTTMHNGGTASKTPDEVDVLIDNTAMVIGISAGRESMEASLKTLTEKLPQSLKLLFELLLHPRFDAGRLEINRMKFIEQLKRDKDTPTTVAVRAFRKLVYGENSPWATVPTEADVRKLKRDDLVKFAQHFVHPSNMLIAVSGDFSADDMIQKIEHALADADDHPAAFPAVPPVALEFKPQTKYIKRDITQANIFMGHLGIKRDNPDKYTISVMNEILGGDTFSARLGREIREHKGLAYTIRSSFTWNADYGIFAVFAGTKAQTKDEVIQLIRDQIGRFWKDGAVSPKEFERAKKTLLNQLIFAYDSAANIAHSQATFRFKGYPADYIEVLQKEIEKITPEDIKRVAHKYLHPDGLKVLVLSNQPPAAK